MDIVCYTAVFSVVTQQKKRGGALRDDTKNGCVADYYGYDPYSSLAFVKNKVTVEIRGSLTWNYFRQIASLAGKRSLIISPRLSPFCGKIRVILLKCFSL